MIEIEALLNFTKMKGARLQHWIEMLRALSVEGDLVECGVWRGGAMMIARHICPDRRCWLYDTFDGMTAPADVDRKVSTGAPAMDSYSIKSRNGRRWNAASVDEVRSNFECAGLWDPDRVIMVPGDVVETLPRHCPDRIAVLRLDTDWHASTKAELEHLYPRLVPGGVLVVDDFGHWAGARQAVLEYFGGAIVSRLLLIDYSAVALMKQ